ncbi:MAG TPA: glycosyltransferase family 39 protein, partial [Acidobacteriaceae bacterium]
MAPAAAAAGPGLPAWNRAAWAAALLAGLALRLWWVHAHAALEGDPQVYADIARNWLTHGVYGVTTSSPAPVSSGAPAGASTVQPTLIRLPGYPLFLALCFRLFGLARLRAVLLVQVAVDLGTCALLASVARRLWSRRAGMVTLWLAALCPFTATYVAAPLTETLELFAMAAALFLFARLAGAPAGDEDRDHMLLAGPQPWRKAWVPALLLGLSWSYAALLRPDGALLAVTLCPAL